MARKKERRRGGHKNIDDELPEEYQIPAGEDALQATDLSERAQEQAADDSKPEEANNTIEEGTDASATDAILEILSSNTQPSGADVSTEEDRQPLPEPSSHSSPFSNAERLADSSPSKARSEAGGADASTDRNLMPLGESQSSEEMQEGSRLSTRAPLLGEALDESGPCLDKQSRLEQGQGPAEVMEKPAQPNPDDINGAFNQLWSTEFNSFSADQVDYETRAYFQL